MPVAPVRSWDHVVLDWSPPVPRTSRPAAPVPHIHEPVTRLTDHAAEARRLANEGSLVEALIACDQAIETDRLVAANYYLRGIILQEQNAVEEAVTALKRALYLDHDFVVAHFMLGNLMLREGRSRDAARCFDNARALLRTQPPETELPDSDGITAGRLLAILTSLQEVAA